MQGNANICHIFPDHLQHVVLVCADGAAAVELSVQALPVYREHAERQRQVSGQFIPHLDAQGLAVGLAVRHKAQQLF